MFIISQSGGNINPDVKNIAVSGAAQRQSIALSSAEEIIEQRGSLIGLKVCRSLRQTALFGRLCIAYGENGSVNSLPVDADAQDIKVTAADDKIRKLSRLYGTDLLLRTDLLCGYQSCRKNCPFF